MKWFEGGIPNAIQAAKDNKSVFIVFVSGEDEASSTMESFLHQDSVTTLCEANRCVAVRLISNTNDCNFFSQIFPVVVIPSVFFIGDNGTPLEVIGEVKSPQDLMVKVQAALELQQQQSNAATSQRSSQDQMSSELNPQAGNSVSPKAEENRACAATGTGSASNSNNSGDEEEEVVGDVGESSPEKKARTQELTKEEKVERARRLVEEKREQKRIKEAEEAKAREQQRRDLGQGVQKLRQNQKEMEMLEAKRELKKDKEEDKIARQRVKEQIARDRAEKTARFNEAKEEREKSQEEARKRKLVEQQAAAAAEQARKSDISRIQFRLPDGSSISNQFPATETFSIVHKFITGHTGHAVSLSTSFPRRTFTHADHDTSLQDLELAPSAVILVIPGRPGEDRGVTSSSRGLAITNILFAPFLFLWNLISSLFGLSSTPAPPSSSSASAPLPAAKGGDRYESSGVRRREPGPRQQQQQGAVHRFHNAEDDEDDEDRATWNGNSTQQM